MKTTIFSLRRALPSQRAQASRRCGVWIKRLAEHLKKQTGTAFSEDQLRRILHQEGFSMQRPKHTMKGKRDEAAYTKASKQLLALKKKPCATRRTSS